jgi:tetratricopeptide (TPR) repeat protein
MANLRPIRVAALLVFLACGALGTRTLIDVQSRRWSREGQSALTAGRYASALSLARRVLWLRPGDPRASLLAARCLARLGREPEAAEHYRRAGLLALDDWRDRALRLLRQDKTDEAMPFLEEVLRLDSGDTEAIRSLAAIRHARGEFVLAEQLANRLIAQPSSELVGQALLATIHHDLAARKVETPAKAIRAFERILELDPGLDRCPIQPRRLVWEFLAHDLIAEGRPADARAHLSRALAAGEDPALVELLGRTHWTEGRLDEARRCWERAAELDPSAADPWIGLGQLALRQDRPADAVTHLERALSLAPNSVKPLYSLIQAQRRIGRPDRAVSLQKRLDELRDATSTTPP